MSGTELQIGAQARAAGMVAGAIEPLQAALRDLGNDVAAASPGFRGAAAGGLGVALDAWFEAAADLLPTLNEYAQHLTAVDVTEAAADARQQAAFSRLASRLGGTP